MNAPIKIAIGVLAAAATAGGAWLALRRSKNEEKPKANKQQPKVDFSGVREELDNMVLEMDARIRRMSEISEDIGLRAASLVDQINAAEASQPGFDNGSGTKAAA